MQQKCRSLDILKRKIFSLDKINFEYKILKSEFETIDFIQLLINMYVRFKINEIV